MPNKIALYAPSAGSDGGAPTLPQSGMFDNFLIGGKRVLFKNYTVYSPHNIGKTVHSSRIIVGGNDKFKFGGYSVSRVADQISCGDTVGDVQTTFMIG